jgi:voltage-gated potassium channel
VVIDVDPATMVDLPSSSVMLPGDATHDATLIRAAIGRARGIAIATPHSATNVYITLAARQMSPTLSIVCRVDDVDAQEKAKRAGANRLIRPYGVGGGRMAQALLHPEASDFVEAATTRAGRDLHLHDVRVGPKFVGGALGTLRMRERTGALVVAIRRADGTLVPAPGPEVLLASGDIVVVVGKPTTVARVRAWLETGVAP